MFEKKIENLTGLKYADLDFLKNLLSLDLLVSTSNSMCGKRIINSTI